MSDRLNVVHVVTDLGGVCSEGVVGDIVHEVVGEDLLWRVSMDTKETMRNNSMTVSGTGVDRPSSPERDCIRSL